MNKEIKKIVPIFARHETFHPRFGWLKKGFDKAVEYQYIFTDENAPMRLGVGKNMVKAIRYWCSALKVLDDIKNGKRTKYSTPTDFGFSLLNGHGWDPYLERIESLWLLHWKLLQPPCYATTWHYVFSEFKLNEFKKEHLEQGLIDYVSVEFPGLNISQSSLERDITCLCIMYARRGEGKEVSEDTLDCPFSSLGIIQEIEGTGYYRFKIGMKPGLAPELVTAACLEFAAIESPHTQTISVSRLLYENGSPGLVFKLNEDSLCNLIEQASKGLKNITLNETAGLLQFSYSESPNKLALQLIQKLYHN